MGIGIYGRIGPTVRVAKSGKLLRFHLTDTVVVLLVNPFHCPWIGLGDPPLLMPFVTGKVQHRMRIIA